MPTPPSTNTRPAGPDSKTAVQFLNDLLIATSNTWLEQAARWSDIYQRLRDGTYSGSRLQQDLARIWEPWLALATFPAQWWLQNSQPLPTLFLLVDSVAETVGPVEVPLNLSVPAGLVPEVQPLQRIGGPSAGQGNGRLDPSFVEPSLSGEGNRLSVRLVGLGGNKTARSDNGIVPGLYLGPVFVKEVALQRPVALLYVFVSEPPKDEKGASST